MMKIFGTHLRYFSNFKQGKDNNGAVKQNKEKNGTYKSYKKLEPEHQLLYGLNSVEAALHTGKRQFWQLYISDSELIELNSKTIKLINFAKERQIKMVYTQKVKLDRMVSNAPHQNVVLKCSPLPENVINKEGKQVFENGVYVYTDKITDPQNFGAIIRSSLFFGVKHIFSSKKNHCPLNATVSKASTGAVELMPISLIENSENFMVNWKEQGGFILSTEVSDVNRRVYPVQELQKLKAEDKLEKMLIVLGSEGFGVSDHLRKHSDYNIIIERKGQSGYPYSLIDSLNVNAALTSILFELTKDAEAKVSKIL